EYGGDMIDYVYKTEATWTDLPVKFEAGTPMIAEAVGLNAAIDYINEIGLDNIYQHEKELVQYAYDKMSEIEGLEIYGTAKDQRAVLITFNLKVGDTHRFPYAVD